MSRPRFWDSLFRRQPVDPGMPDPISADREDMSRRLRETSRALHGALNALAVRLRDRETNNGTSSSN